MIQIGSDISFLEYLKTDKPAFVDLTLLSPAHKTRQISSDLVLFALSLGASVPLNLVAAWLWAKIEARKTADPTVIVNVYVYNTRVYTQQEMIATLNLSSDERASSNER